MPRDRAIAINETALLWEAMSTPYSHSERGGFEESKHVEIREANFFLEANFK